VIGRQKSTEYDFDLHNIFSPLVRAYVYAKQAVFGCWQSVLVSSSNNAVCVTRIKVIHPCCDSDITRITLACCCKSGNRVEAVVRLAGSSPARDQQVKPAQF